MTMKQVTNLVSAFDNFVWGPAMLVLLVGTGVFLTIRLRFLTWRNLGYSLKSVLSKKALVKQGNGDVSPFSALMTALASTIGTGNIIGVATAMFTGGPGALVWMWISACFGLTTKYSECMLASKYREVNENGEMSGGPMYTMKNGIKNKTLATFLAGMFSIFTVMASFGVGNMTQANSISSSVHETFGLPTPFIGIALAIFIFFIVIGGIQSISKVATVVVPAMAVFYVIGGLAVIAGNIANVPHGLYTIFMMAFHPKAVSGGVMGVITVSMMNAIRFGVARGVFSNEAGLGSAAISAAAASSDDPVQQGYINMTGTFFDTLVVCSITGIAIAASGVLGTVGADGKPLEGVQITMAAFETVLGPAGRYVITIGIIFFAFSTILGWEYSGEKAIEYLLKTPKYNIIYRIIFPIIVFFGATQSLDLVWSFSDIANALMAIPNLICLLLMSNVIAEETFKFQKRRDHNM